MAAKDSKSEQGVQDQPEHSPYNLGNKGVKYAFLWSEMDEQDPKRFEMGSHILIYDLYDGPDDNGRTICEAHFGWRSWSALFSCVHDHSTNSFSEFATYDEFMEGGMEVAVQDPEANVTISFGQSFEGGNGERLKREVLDDRGNPFMFVHLYFGHNGFWEKTGDIVGKKVLYQGEWDDMVLSEGERERLGIMEEEWAMVDVGEEEDKYQDGA